MPAIRLLSAIIAIGAFMSSQALAADLFAQEAPSLGPQEKLEFGTGWYLRGDIAWAREKDPVIFPDGALGQAAKVTNSWSTSIGGGYKFNNWFRADLTYDYRKPTVSNITSAEFACPVEIRGLNDTDGITPIGIYAINNQCRAQQNSRLNRYALLANAYLDLGTWAGVSPYIGAGAGVSYGKVSGNYDWIDQANQTHYGPNLVIPAGFPIVWMDAFGNPVPPGTANFGVQDRRAAISKNQFNMAWALMAGVAYDVSPNAKIDMGYRYLNLGRFGNGTKSATVSEYRIGVRYMID